ncbi:unnamed protein product [Oppiella nova]|uniref:Phospholipase B-like n=1 Tax=Oppiella nova TaxID=334625 RepID=A0A7R9LM75_9ACAR|nr:unnamed protein product [Oppiella nova]CAG2164390.1 unnamed protein product [Oppiella nova]
MLVIIIGGICIALALFYYQRVRRMTILERHGIPGPKPHLIFGNMFDYNTRGYNECYDEWKTKYGRVFGYYLGAKPFIVVTDPELLKLIQIKEFHHFSHRPYIIPGGIYRNWKYHQMVTRVESFRWKKMRTILSPWFSSSQLKSVVPIINVCIDHMMAKLEANAGDGHDFNIYSLLEGLTMDTIDRSAFSIRTDIQDQFEGNPLIEATRGVFSIKPSDFLASLLLCLPEFSVIINILRDISEWFSDYFGNSSHGLLLKAGRTILDNRLEAIRSQTNDMSGAGRKDMLQLMVDARDSNGSTDRGTGDKSLTDVEIIANTIVVHEAAYESPANILAFIIHNLIQYPDIQRKLCDEIDGLYARDGRFDYNVMSGLPLTEAVVCETFRLFPTDTLFTSRAPDMDYRFGEHVLPKGVDIRIPTFQLHRDLELWPQALQFNPMRFMDKESTIDSVVYQPFGVGPRICPGKRFGFLEIKLVLAKLLHNWAQIEIHTNEGQPDSQQAYYAGVVEGYLTHELIANHYHNKLHDYFADDSGYELRLKQFMDTNLEFMAKQVHTYRSTDPYWHCVALVLEQITGLQDGYDWRTRGHRPLGPRIDIRVFQEVFLLNLIPDLDVLEEVLRKKCVDRLLGEGKCSAIVKPLADGTDLLVAHNMWSTYHSMLRLVKKYDFRYHMLPNSNTGATNGLIPGHCMAHTSYPGAVLSLDDFYITSAGLVVQETTFEILNNETLWESVKPDSVLEFIRVLVANRLSTGGAQWAQVFSRYNSGTYNSQFMVVDYKLFRTGTTPDQLADNTLWICEQLPALIRSQDMTEHLRRHHYWPSYNVPFFDNIYTNGGYHELTHKYGDYFSYYRCPRAQIFSRDHSSVRDTTSLMRLMRSNDYTVDPLSRYPDCTPGYSADLAIAARNDLNDPDGRYAIPVLGFRARGAIDAKVTGNDMVRAYGMYAVSGPTHLSQPPFQWSTTRVSGVRHEGQPDKWHFPPVTVDWLFIFGNYLVVCDPIPHRNHRYSVSSHEK